MPTAGLYSCSRDHDHGAAPVVAGHARRAHRARDPSLRARYELSLDEFRGLYISNEQVDRLIASRFVPGDDEAEPPVRPAVPLREHDARWRRLSQAFDLTDVEEDVLLIALAPELDLKYEVLYAYLNDDVTRKWPTIDLVSRLLADLDDADAMAAVLAPAARLLGSGLMRRIDPPAGRPASLNTGLLVNPCVVQWVRHRSPWTVLPPEVTWTPPGDLEFDAAAWQRASPILRLFADTEPEAPAARLVLRGATGSGRTRTAAAIAASLGRPLVQVDLEWLQSGSGEHSHAVDALRAALTLEPAVVLLDAHARVGPDGDPARRPADLRLARALAAWPPATVVTVRAGDGENVSDILGGKRQVDVRCETETFAERTAAWTEATRAHGILLSAADLGSLAGRFALTPAGHAQPRRPRAIWRRSRASR